MFHLKGLRYRLYPSPEQAADFERIAGCCRLVYNLGLEQRRDHWRNFRVCTGNSISWFSQNSEMPEMKREFPFLKAVPSHCLQAALGDLNAAYQRFFDGLSGYPKPRRKFQHDSFAFPDRKQIEIRHLGNGWAELVLPKFGRTAKDGGAIRMRLHRQLVGEIRKVTISRDGGHWFASVLVKVRHKAPATVTNQPIEANDVIGIDRGVAVPFALSNGEMLGNKTEGKRQIERQKRLQRAVSRRKRGSANRAKACRALAAHKAKVARRRRDTTHKITHAIAKNHRVVVIEKLAVKAMTASARGTAEEPGCNVAQKAGLNRVILDKGWGEFRRQLGYKLAWQGKMLLEVPARNTSRTCGSCAHVAAESRMSQAIFACVACGHTANADMNAAVEIRRRGLQALGVDTRKERPGQPVEPSALALAMKQETENEDIRSAAIAAA